jgi:hypothetical protein
VALFPELRLPESRSGSTPSTGRATVRSPNERTAAEFDELLDELFDEFPLYVLPLNVLPLKDLPRELSPNDRTEPPVDGI